VTYGRFLEISVAVRETAGNAFFAQMPKWSFFLARGMHVRISLTCRDASICFRDLKIVQGDGTVCVLCAGAPCRERVIEPDSRCALVSRRGEPSSIRFDQLERGFGRVKIEEKVFTSSHYWFYRFERVNVQVLSKCDFP